jgi:WD40 repeat protein
MTFRLFLASLMTIAASTEGRGVTAEWTTVRIIQHPSQVLAVAFVPPGGTIVTACADSVVRLWDVTSGRLRGQFRGQFCPIAVSPDGAYLATYSRRHITVFDLAIPKAVCRVPCAVELSTAFSPDSRFLAAGGVAKKIAVWDVPDGRLLAELAADTARIEAVAFSPTTTRLAGGSFDNSILLWDLKTSAVCDSIRPPRRKSVHSPGVLSLSFGPDGSTVAASEGAGQYVYPVPHGRPPLRLVAGEGFKGPAFSIAVSPDGRFIVAGDSEGAVRVWAASDGSVVATLTGHTGSVRSVAFSPDGRVIATGSEDHTVRFWRMR